MKIEIYLQFLSQLAPKQPDTFAHRAAFKQYQQQLIYAYRAEMLAAQLGLSAQDLHFEKTEHGKPFLGNYPELAFNHSHGREHYALALSLYVQDVGIDIESLQRKVRFQALAEHAFHPEEYQHWQATGQSPEYWFQVWTAKEAILKACGLGIRLSLNTLNTQAVAGQQQGFCQHPELGEFRYQHMVWNDALCTVAWRDVEGVTPEILYIKP
ncbi:4'-phosphopantetheinyl transferase family protein [Acinetobacter sp. MB5]|uniref:4'-phosphopantetheinyl transferase family protein n=1 Tax=Acinetobacter sp. MB5 TaxID=2069438 RepID=UPI000DCF9A07|nr:4'-phosphopantetheinyl transferase superfamily protein [Acinetobacter sp. MB5]